MTSLLSSSSSSSSRRPSHPLVWAAPYHRCVEWLEAMGCDRGAFLADAAVPADVVADPDGRLTLDQVERLCLAAGAFVQHHCPDLSNVGCLLVGASLSFPAFGSAGFAALTAPDLDAATVVLERYQSLVSPLFSFRRAITAEHLRVRVRPVYPLDPVVLRMHFEGMASLVHSLAHLGARRSPHGLRVELPFRSPQVCDWLVETGIETAVSSDGLVACLPWPLVTARFPLADEIAHRRFLVECERRLNPAGDADRAGAKVLAFRRRRVLS